MKKEWKEFPKEMPKTEGYYMVKFLDGKEDEKPFRIRPKKTS